MTVKSEERPLRGVVFDMDGVLCDSEPFLFEAAHQLFRQRFGLDVTREDFAPFVGTGENRYMGGVAETYGVELQQPADKQLLYQIYLGVIRGRLKALPGVHDFVEQCRKRGKRLAVATSADHIKMEGNLTEIGLPTSLFDSCVTGSEVERKKPAPDIFLHAIRALDIPAEETLVLEDAPSGIEAARLAGTRSLGITTTFSSQQLKEAGATWLAPDLLSVPGELKNLLNRR